jgi:hypothetical protein
MADLQFEVVVLEQLTIISQKITLLSKAVAQLSKKETQQMAVTQQDIDSLTQRVMAEGAVEDAALEEIKADFAAFQQANPGLDISELQAQVTAAESRATAEQQVADANQPTQPAPGSPSSPDQPTA